MSRLHIYFLTAILSYKLFNKNSYSAIWNLIGSFMCENEQNDWWISEMILYQ
jgi:hypothetical protein